MRRGLTAIGIAVATFVLGFALARTVPVLTGVQADAVVKDGRLYYSDGTPLTYANPAATPTPTLAPTPTPTPAPTPTATPAPTATPTPAPLTDVPLVSTSWTINQASDGATITWNAGVMSLNVPASATYPRARVFATGYAVAAGQAYTIEVEARAVGADFNGNLLVGLNMLPGFLGNPNFFQHWHFNQGVVNFYGDWTEAMIVSAVPLDHAWHTFRLEFTGFQVLTYKLDGVTVAVQQRPRTDGIADISPGDRAGFTAYAESYPGTAAKTLEIRRFSVKVG